MGFPKYYDDNRLVETLRHFYGSHFNSLHLVILYGSKKPESDIDLFVVSDNKSFNYTNGWLDIYELNIEEFEDLATKMDISVTDPLFGGDLIFGNVQYLSRIKNELEHKEVTTSMISHNQSRACEQEQLSNLVPQNSREYKICKGYAQSYNIMSRELQTGKKYMTKNQLINNYHS
jgi:hypothetical protein